MKKILSNLMLVAAAAMAFSACQKTEMVEPETSQEVMLTFASEKPAFDDETKTEWTGETIQWSAGDKISVAYTVNGNWQNASGDASGDAMLYKSDALEAATETAKFNVSASFEGTTEGTHVFYGVYPAPSSTSFADAPVATLTVPSIQTPGVSSFDGSADLMTGVSVGEFTSLPTEPISMKWTRLVAHANITLKALNGVTAGETVSSITLTAQEGANLVGSQKVDITANTVVNNNNESNVLELNGGNLSIDASGNIEFWACVLPETLTSLAVVVETNKATYTREITGISKTFKQNARNTLSIKMNEATRVAKETSDYSGIYVIVAKRNSDSKYYYMINDEGTASTKRLVAVLAGDTCPEDVSSLPISSHWEIINSEDLYKAKSVESNTYISWTSGNSACLKEDGVPFSISMNEEDGTYNFEYAASDASRFLSLNGTTGNNYFAWYKSGQMADLYLIPVVPDNTPSITVEETLELTSAESEGTISVTYNNLEALDAAAYSDADCTVDCDWLVAAWENDASENGAVSYIAEANEGEERTAYIQIYALDAEANEYTKVITVTQAAYVDPGVVHKVTVTEFNALEGTETATYELTGTVAEIYQAYNSTYDNISFYIEDETGKVLIFRMDCGGDSSLASLKTGDKVTVQGTPTLYNSSIQMAEGGVCTYYQAACNAPEIICVDNLVTITAETGATIYYTTDGNDPTTSSDVYSTPFEVTEANSPMTVKAIAVADGKVASVVASKTCTYVDPNGGGDVAEPVTVSKLIKDISGTTANGTQVLDMVLDNVITATASSGTNNGKVYSTGSEWRLYMSDSGTVTIKAIDGYTINTVKFTYTASNNGVLLNANSQQISSGTVDTVNAQSVTYTVGRTSGTKQGQVRVTAIEVVYQAN